jgi:hypothetical protein
MKRITDECQTEEEEEEAENMCNKKEKNENELNIVTKSV